MSSSPALAPARRAGRPHRSSRDLIVDAAIAVADEHGVDAISMNRLAQRLGVGTMTLYGYIPGKHALLDEMTAALLDETGPHPDPLSYLTSLDALASDHPSLPQLVAARSDMVWHRLTAIGGASEAGLRAALSYTIGHLLVRGAADADASDIGAGLRACLALR